MSYISVNQQGIPQEGWGRMDQKEVKVSLKPELHDDISYNHRMSSIEQQAIWEHYRDSFCQDFGSNINGTARIDHRNLCVVKLNTQRNDELQYLIETVQSYNAEMKASE